MTVRAMVGAIRFAAATYELAVRLRILLERTDCESVLLTHANGTVFQATRDGELTILADERVAFDPDEARYGLGPVPDGALDVEPAA